MKRFRREHVRLVTPPTFALRLSFFLSRLSVLDVLHLDLSSDALLPLTVD